MSRVSLSLLVLALGLGLVGLGFAQSEKSSSKSDDKEEMKKDDGKSAEKPRLRGQLPANYKKLGLSTEQTQKIYKIQSEFDKKIGDLEEQLKKLKDEERKEIEGVLTPGQKTRLKEIKADK